MKYKLIDTQGGGMRKDIVYNSLKEIHEDLQDFHSQDNDTKNWSLVDCLEIGGWNVVDAETGADVEIEAL